MAIVGVGMDMIRISRIAAAVERHGERFLRRLFHPREVEVAYSRRLSAEYLAGCFAVKEATLKAMGDFPGRAIDWADIYITHEWSGKPVLHLEGEAKKLSDEKGARRHHVSITHDGDLAAAYVILETE
ncbi:MAG: holo-[acyl-carrier-protein] synthase [bacterium]|nr:holo-[acyl-carrier-protein] synthase [bacterium]